MNELDLLKIVTKRLNHANINYMVSGSIALNFYATPRMTRDIDIVIQISELDVENFVNLFKQNFYIDNEMIIDAIRHSSMFNIIHLESVIKIDFIIRKKSEYRIHEFEKRQKISIGNSDFYIVALEDLIISKIYWIKESKSDYQIKDIKSLLNNKCDMDYIKKWCQTLEIGPVLQEVINYE